MSIKIFGFVFRHRESMQRPLNILFFSLNGFKFIRVKNKISSNLFILHIYLKNNGMNYSGNQE